MDKKECCNTCQNLNHEEKCKGQNASSMEIEKTILTKDSEETNKDINNQFICDWYLPIK